MGYLQEIYECSFGFTVNYAFRSLGAAVIWFSFENHLVTDENWAIYSFLQYWLILLLALLIFLISVIEEGDYSLHIENITPASDQNCILNHILFSEVLLTVLSLNKVYGPINFKLLLWVSILSILRDVGPGCSCPKCNFISQWKIMLCIYAWHLHAASAGKGGGKFSSDRDGYFPVTKWLFCIARGSRNAVDPSLGSTSHLLITLLQVKVKML